MSISFKGFTKSFISIIKIKDSMQEMQVVVLVVLMAFIKEFMAVIIMAINAIMMQM